MFLILHLPGFHAIHVEKERRKNSPIFRALLHTVHDVYIRAGAKYFGTCT